MRFVLVALLVLSACVDYTDISDLPEPDDFVHSCETIREDSVLVDFGNAEAIITTDSVPVDIKSFYRCPDGTVHVHDGARVSRDFPKVTRGVVVVDRKGECNFAPIDSVRVYEGEVCK